MGEQSAIIVGAGPAGLTAAFEFATRSEIAPTVFESSERVGGIACTIEYKGNRIDIGGHRFFSKSDRVMCWWTNLLPIQGVPITEPRLLDISYRGRTRRLELPEGGPDPEREDLVMLVRPRVSRILHRRTFFDYPVRLSFDTLRKLGARRIGKTSASYLQAKIFPISPELTLEDFFINRFGRELYLTFFKDYTEKVWGCSCREIDANWGAQRVKKLSILKALRHDLSRALQNPATVKQKDTDTSLIEYFLYPKLGPGQLWERTREIVAERGGEVHCGKKVVALKHEGKRVTSAIVKDLRDGREVEHSADYFISTMPVVELIKALGDGVPESVRAVSDNLVYRDFVTVGVLLKRLRIGNRSSGSSIPDNWIYVQEKDVKVGRIQVFNNWSPYLVADPNTVWLGLEYFCNEGDELWSRSDAELSQLAVDELRVLGFISPEDFLDSVAIRMSKAYPAYTGSYDRFDVVRDFIDGFENLYVAGRNGMHRYNNQDHSMLSAMVIVDHVVSGGGSKRDIWAINTERDYHEET